MPYITEEKFKELTNRLDELSKKVEGESTPKPIKPTYHVAEILYYDDKPVLDLKNVKQDPKDGRLYGELMVMGMEKPIIVDYLELVNNGERKTVKIVSQVEKLRTEIRGAVTRKDYQDYKQIDTGVEVPVEVQYKDVVYTVELPTGETIEMSKFIR